MITVEQALALVDQERLDYLAEKDGADVVEDIAAFKLASEVRILSKEIARLIRDAEYLSIEKGQLKEEIVGLQHVLKAAREALELLLASGRQCDCKLGSGCAMAEARAALEKIDVLGEK